MNNRQIVIFSVITLLLEYNFVKSLDLEERLTQISKSGKCTDDLKKLCNHGKIINDIEILICFQESEDVMKQISDECQHYLWEYKHKLTTSDIFDGIVNEQCSTVLDTIEQCKKAATGHKVTCLVDHKDKITDQPCLKFLDMVSLIVFSDYHLIYRFTRSCNADIKKFRCGRISNNLGNIDKDKEIDNSEKSMSETGLKLEDYVTSQAHTIDCLIDSVKELDDKCRLQILRLGELQSNDYHLNRALYYACQDDREVLCHNVKSGEGRVYRCLMGEKFNEKMSKRCREELTRKQQVESQDAKASYSMMIACKNDIRDNLCMGESSETDHFIVQLSEVILCLNTAEINGKTLQPICRNEVTEKRKEMMEDLQISPETLLACKSEFQHNCKDLVEQPGAVVHCLMKLAEPDKLNKYGRLSKQCQDSLMTLIQAADPVDDVMTVDRNIRDACSSTYTALCSHVTDIKGAFQCLLDNINSPEMTGKCREKLSSLLYFMGMDIRIDYKLNNACHLNAVKLCNGPDTVEKTLKRTKEQAQTEYFCMYQHYKEDKIALDLAQAKGLPLSDVKLSLSAECSHEIFNLIKIQAMKVEFNPKVFIECFDDISRYCGGEEFRGKEFQCLQNNIKRLEAKCYSAIVEFTEMEDLDFRLNNMARSACIPMVSKLCAHEKVDSAMTCLMENKFHPKMSTACQVAIEHYQILSLEEYHIDHRFASFCGPDIEQYCQAEITKEKTSRKHGNVGKAAIVSCLSRTVTKELLAGNKHPLREECRRQFSFELIQRSTSTKLDPRLIEDCGTDIDKFCKNIKSSNINGCLRENQDKLDDRCHQRLFDRERLEALDAEFDGELQLRCSQMIDVFCRKVPGRMVFQCLHRMVNEPDFDSDCKRVILLRLERRMHDIRLNPGLIKDCSEDIKSHCNIDDPNKDAPAKGIEYAGKIILCLKKSFTNGTLTDKCRRRLLPIIIESNTNTRLDPSLRKGCDHAINQYCKKELVDNNLDPVDSVQNCLKHKFLRGEIRSEECKDEVKRLLREGRADVHIDGELFDACENSIMKLCRSESFGFGRKMSCLLSFVDDHKASALIETRCLSLIKERREMWSLVSNFEPQSLGELYDHIASSSTKVYLLSMLSLMILGLLLLGICCGRVSKKVLIDHKNK